MARVNAAEYAEKWGRRLKGSTEDIRRGVENVSVSPGEMAIKQKELLKQKIIEAIDNGTWEAGLKNMSLDDWKRKTLDKGLQRIGAGVDASMSKQQQMAEKLLADVDASVAATNKIPRGSFEDNLNRMTTFAREMHKRKQKK